MSDTKRILLDGYATEVTRSDDQLVAADGRRIATADTTHLAPTEPRKIICVHLNYLSRDFRDTDAGSMLRVKGSDTLCPVGPHAMSPSETIISLNLFPTPRVAA